MRWPRLAFPLRLALEPRLIGPLVSGFRQPAKWRGLCPRASAGDRGGPQTPPSPEAGLLWQKNFLSGRVVMTWQFWTSMEKLFAYAHDRQAAHFPAWAEFNRKAKGNHAVGIWHETYALTPEACENIYRNMPAFGLGAAIGTAPAVARMGGLRDPFDPGRAGGA